MREQLVDAFVTNIKKNQHLRSLLPKEEWLLVIKIGKNQWNISFSRNKIQMATERDDGDGVLQCSFEDWEYMVSGERKLRQLLKMGDTDYKGTFRSLLMLESLFYLAPSMS